MAKASAEGGATHYVAEGDPVPDDLPEGVRLVGPGAPAEPEPGDPEPEPEAEAEAEALPPGEDKDGPVDYESLPVAVLRELARERGITQHGALKADLVAELIQWDADHPDGDDGAPPDGG